MKEEFNDLVPNGTNCEFFDKNANPVVYLSKYKNKTTSKSTRISDCLKAFIRSVSKDGKWVEYNNKTFVRFTPGFVKTTDKTTITDPTTSEKSTSEYKNGYSSGFNEGIVGNSTYLDEMIFSTQYPNYGKDGTEDGFSVGLDIYNENYKNTDYMVGCQTGFNDGFELKDGADTSTQSEDYENGYEDIRTARYKK